MEAYRRISVAILYRHQLFGEGIAHYLAGEPYVRTECVAIGAGDPPAEALASWSRPDVVIVERSDRETGIDLLQAFPEALVVDVALDSGPTFTWRREEIGSQPDEIVRTIREVAAGSGGSARVAASGSAALRSGLATAGRS